MAPAMPAPGIRPIRATTPSGTSPDVVGEWFVAFRAPGTQLTPDLTQQVMIARWVSGTSGTWRRYEWRGLETGWAAIQGGDRAVFGYNGVRPAAQRVQGDGTTPLGTFPIRFTFGPANPGTSMPYFQVTQCSWWIGDQSAPDYNQWRESCASTPRDSEHLADYTSNAYRQAAVIGFNDVNPIRWGPGSGSAIFLHYGETLTAGCVGIQDAELTATIRWLDPTKWPVIVITT